MFIGEDARLVIFRKSKDRFSNGQRKKGKKTNNGRQNTKQKA